jgi:predicted N-acetyltransferase YhbS
VDREYQRRGIGRELVRRLSDLLGDEVMLLLLAAPEAMDYYPHIGFEKADNAWHLSRKR